MKTIQNILTVALVFASSVAFTQCKAEKELCNSFLPAEYISDGQTYKAMLFGDQVAQFDATFFENSTYRIAGASGNKAGNLIISISDENGTELFNNHDYMNAPYWDFVMQSTMKITINAKLDQKKTDSGCAALLIGFKK